MSSVDVLRPKTWVRYEPSMCRGCWAACCTLPVVVNAEDLYHMGYLTLYQVNGPLKRIANRLIKEGIVRSYRDRNRTFILQRTKADECIFLDENRRCKIYDRRPFVCRKFPVNAVRPGFCPSQRKSAVKAASKD
jgi:uncharacterized protein